MLVRVKTQHPDGLRVYVCFGSLLGLHKLPENTAASERTNMYVHRPVSWAGTACLSPPVADWGDLARSGGGRCHPSCVWSLIRRVGTAEIAGFQSPHMPLSIHRLAQTPLHVQQRQAEAACPLMKRYSCPSTAF